MVLRRSGANRFAACLLLALSCLGTFAAASSPAAVPGAVSAITWGQSRADVDREVELLRSAGAHYVRANVNWAGLEPDRKGALDSGALAMYDYAVDRARAAGLEVIMPISDGVPYWASGDPRKYVDSGGTRRWDRYHPPADFADYGDVVEHVAQRYSARGVQVYEIWNEPNLRYFWSSGPDPAEYVKMLREGHAAVKRADASSTVLLGGLSKNDFSYLEGVYRAGGGPYFDAVAVHPYTYGVDPTVSWNGVNAGEDPARLSKNSFPAIKEIRRSMDAFGDASKDVWITEFGYSTTSHDGGVTEAQQAAFLTKAYGYVERFPWVKAMLWYSARNSPFTGDRDDYEAQFGLVSAGWQPKASLTAFKAYAATQPSMTPTPPPPATPTPVPTPTPSATPTAMPSPVPDLTASPNPTVALVQPVGGTRFTSALTLAAEATDDVWVDRVEFRVDGKIVATRRIAPYSAEWTAGRKVRLGDHIVTATAYDDQGRSASAKATVRRVSGTSAGFARAPSTRPQAHRRRGGELVVKGSIPVRWRRADRVTVELQRRGAGGWWTVRRAPAALRGSRYRTTMRAPVGRWRVRVTLAPRAGVASWTSPYRRFSV